jgi:hypothetical protein
MKMMFYCLGLITLFVSFGFGQSDDYNKNEVFGGYAHSSDFKPTTNENGFDAAFVHNLHRYFGVKTGFSGVYTKFPANSFYQTTNIAYYTATFGVQIRDNSTTKRIKPFAHGLVGLGAEVDKFKRVPNTCPACQQSSTALGVLLSATIGGGLDIKINNKIDIRVIQIDLSSVSIEESPAFGKLKLSTGLIFKF